MPARRNRPGKHGATSTQGRKIPSKLELNAVMNAQVRELAIKFIVWERKEPKKDHYVGWPDMDVAEEMQRRGLIKLGGLATGCFYITDLFRTEFYEEMH